MSETVIPSSGKVKNPGANQKYVSSRSGGPSDAMATKNASIKHQNPEYFKRQSDRKNSDSMKKLVDGGPGSGPKPGGGGMSERERYLKENPPVALKSKQELAAENFKKRGGDPESHNKKFGGPAGPVGGGLAKNSSKLKAKLAANANSNSKK